MNASLARLAQNSRGMAHQGVLPEFDIGLSRDYDKFAVHSPFEISAVLRSAVNRRMSMAMRTGQRLFRAGANLLEVTPDHEYAVFEMPPDKELAARIHAAEEFAFATRIDNVDVKFQTTRAIGAGYHGHAAWRVPVPASLLRIQRREFFRLALLNTATARVPRCRIELQREDRTYMAPCLIMDISCGGFAGSISSVDFPLVNGRHYECTLELAARGTLQCALDIRSIHTPAHPAPHTQRRFGARFVNLSLGDQSRLQRYILLQERDKRARPTIR